MAASPISLGRTIRFAVPPTPGTRRYVRNNTPQTVTFAWSTGTGVAFTTGQAGMLCGDGTNAFAVGKV